MLGNWCIPVPTVVERIGSKGTVLVGFLGIKGLNPLKVAFLCKSVEKVPGLIDWLICEIL